jgi:nucleotide-binding universal stress UspA family protein
MEEFAHPSVVVGVDGSLSGLAAIRAAVAEARRRGLPLLGLRARTTGIACVDATAATTAFLEALGAMPADLQIELRVSWLSISEALCAAAADPRDLIVVGTSGKGPWHAIWSGSVAFAVTRHARCPVLAVPAPEMSRTVRRPHRWHGRSQWDPLRELEEQRPEFHGQPYSGI